MPTTNTDYDYYWYVRKKGTRYYLGLVDQDGDAIGTSSLDIEIYYDEVPDELDDQDDTLPIPIQFEWGFLKGVAAELMAMSNSGALDLQLRREFQNEYEKTIREAIHYQIEESGQPTIMKPLDLRDDDTWSR